MLPTSLDYTIDPANGVLTIPAGSLTASFAVTVTKLGAATFTVTPAAADGHKLVDTAAQSVSVTVVVRAPVVLRCSSPLSFDSWPMLHMHFPCPPHCHCKGVVLHRYLHQRTWALRSRAPCMLPTKKHPRTFEQRTHARARNRPGP